MDQSTGKCPRCGKGVGTEDKFCASCGGPVMIKTDGGWRQVAAWPVLTIMAILVYPPRLGEDYKPVIFYNLASCIAFVAIVGTIITRRKVKDGSFSRGQIWGPVLSLFLVFITVLNSLWTRQGETTGLRLTTWRRCLTCVMQEQPLKHIMLIKKIIRRL
jgi:hypothetical protein